MTMMTHYHDHITHLLDSAAHAATLPNRLPGEPFPEVGEPVEFPYGEEYAEESYVDANGELRTVYRYIVAPGPILPEGADVTQFPDRQSAEEFLSGGGWLDSLWGPMSAAPDYWVRVAAAAQVHAQAQWPGDSWLDD